MPLFEDISEIVVTQLAVKPEMVKPEARLIEDLGADSLDAMEMVTAVEEKFGITIPDEDAQKVKTVAELIALVEKLQAEPAG